VGLLVFIIYFNLLSAGKAWVEQETVSVTVGLWWVHGIMLGLALVLLAYQNGVHRRILSFRRS
jgi:lipopolysaccharide export system permease protein